MSEAACDLAPCRIALSLQERGDVIEYNDVSDIATFSGQRSAGAHERAMAGFPAELDLLTPFFTPRGKPDGERRHELPEAVTAGRQLRKSTSCRGGQIHAQNGARGLIGDAH